jgi:hypothetical protein
VKIGAVVAAAALASASALATVQSAAFARPLLSSSPKTAGLSVSGKVTCPPGQPVDGLWVNSSGGGSNYARWRRAASRSSASYSTWLQTSTPTAVSLHVGCGGSTVDWKSANWTPAVLMVTRSQTINAECLGGQCVFPSAERAAAWAQRHLAVASGANRALPSDRVADKRAYASWAGLDLAFVVSAYLNGAGTLPDPAVLESANADSMYRAYASDHLVQQAWVTSSGVSPDPPAGALVFYSGPASGGHIAISTGAGKVVSANPSGSRLVRQQSYASIPGYRGWAFPANMVAGPPVSLQPTAPDLPHLHPIEGAGHAAKSAANPRPSAPSPASAASRWISYALTGCLVLLAMFALVFAGRALLAARRRYGRRRHQDAGSLAAAANWHNPASGRGQAADAPLATSGMVTAAPSPLRKLPPAPCPPPPGSPAPLPDTPPATSEEAADPVSVAGLEAPHMAELVTVGGNGTPATKSKAGTLPLAPPLPGRGDDGRPGARERPVFSPAALRLLGLREHPAGGRPGVAQRHEVVFEDCRVETVLAEAPANSRTGKSPGGRGWVASAPYLVWTPLPHDVPAGGTAFACVGAGDAGCLFIDLAAAPGALTLGGEPEAASRLAESLVHQLCKGPAADRVRLVVVADALPEPAPSRAEWVVSVGQLGECRAPRTTGETERTVGKTELVFCRVGSDGDVLGLARYVASAPYRVVPVVLADLPGAPWSFSTHPFRDPARAPESSKP